MAVAGIHEPHTLGQYTLGQSGRLRRFDLLKGDLGLGLDRARLRDLGLVPTRIILGPILSEIAPISDGRLASWVAGASVTATGQLSCLPSRPQYCRVTPTECRPFLDKPVSSMIQTSTGPLRSSPGSTSSPTLASIAASDHGAFPTK